MAHEFKFKVDNNFLKFIGRELYSSVPAIISEMISNALDAKAENIEIKFKTNPVSLEIIDDGEGMSREDISNLYLNVGYNKRELIKDDRKVMGRKGIGKFSVFGLGNKIDLFSKKDKCDTTGISMDYTSLVDEKGKLYENTDNSFQSHGTKIVITDFIKKNLNLGVQIYHIKAMIFKSFLPILENDEKNIKILLDDKEVGMKYSPSDIKKYADIILNFGVEDYSKIKDMRSFNEVEAALSSDVRSRKIFDYTDERYVEAYKELKTSLIKLGVQEKDCGIKGYLLALRNLKDMSYTIDNEDKKSIKTSYNVISIYSNDKMGQADILSDVKTATTYDRYLFGKIEANFLEVDNLGDIASSNRASYNKEDERMMALTLFIKKIVKIVTKEKKDFNKAINEAKIEKNIPAKDGFLEDVSKFFENEEKNQEFVKQFGQSSYQFIRSVQQKEVREAEKSGTSIKKIFISHDSRNKLEGQFIVNVLEEVGVDPESILFTSSDNRKQRVRFNRNFLKEIDKTTRTSRMAIFLLSKEFYDSNMSLAEAGGVWAKELTHGIVLCGGFKNEWISVPLSSEDINIKFNDFLVNDDKTLDFFETVFKQIQFNKSESEILNAIKKVRLKPEYISKNFDKTYIPLRRFQISRRCRICKQHEVIGKNLISEGCQCEKNNWEDGYYINDERIDK